MAEDKADPAAQLKTKKKLPLKMLAVLVSVFLIEAGAICTAFVFAGGPSEVQADPQSVQAAAEADQPVEVQVLADKFQNSRTGRAYLYDTEIYIVVKQKDQAVVKRRMEARHAQIRADIATIFRRAQPSYLHEPELSTLTRQITASLNASLGRDADGKPLVQEVLIGKMTEFPPM